MEEEALHLHGRVAQLEDQLAALRSSRIGGLKRELEEKDALVKDLRRRRGAGQRTLAEANLERRRARLAQEKARGLEEAFRQHIVGEMERQANQPGRRDTLVESLQEQLKLEKELRTRYEAIAKPAKEYFFKEGHFSTEVDLTALEVNAGSVRQHHSVACSATSRSTSCPIPSSP